MVSQTKVVTTLQNGSVGLWQGYSYSLQALADTAQPMHINNAQTLPEAFTL